MDGFRKFGLKSDLRRDDLKKLLIVFSVVNQEILVFGTQESDRHPGRVLPFSLSGITSVHVSKQTPKNY